MASLRSYFIRARDIEDESENVFVTRLSYVDEDGTKIHLRQDQGIVSWDTLITQQYPPRLKGIHVVVSFTDADEDEIPEEITALERAVAFRDVLSKLRKAIRGDPAYASFFGKLHKVGISVISEYASWFIYKFVVRLLGRYVKYANTPGDHTLKEISYLIVDDINLAVLGKETYLASDPGIAAQLQNNPFYALTPTSGSLFASHEDDSDDDSMIPVIASQSPFQYPYPRRGRNPGSDHDFPVIVAQSPFY